MRQTSFMILLCCSLTMVSCDNKLFGKKDSNSSDRITPIETNVQMSSSTIEILDKASEVDDRDEKLA